MSTPQNVINFRSRTGYQEAVRKQRDCQQEGQRPVTSNSPLADGLQRIKAWLDNGVDPVEACAHEAIRSRALIEQEAKALSQYTTPHASAVFLRKLADELEGKP